MKKLQESRLNKQMKDLDEDEEEEEEDEEKEEEEERENGRDGDIGRGERERGEKEGEGGRSGEEDRLVRESSAGAEPHQSNNKLLHPSRPIDLSSKSDFKNTSSSSSYMQLEKTSNGSGDQGKSSGQEGSDEEEEFEALYQDYQHQLEMEDFKIESLLESTHSSFFEPDVQLLLELKVAKPKKKHQKRDSAMDFMLMLNHPSLFEPLFTQAPPIEEGVQKLIQTTQELYKLYTYHPPFHPTHLGVDQFTVEQHESSDYFNAGEEEELQHVGDQ